MQTLDYRHTGRHCPNWRTIAVIWAIASGLAALLGPLGTFETFTFSGRLAYWTLVIGVSLATGFGLRAILSRVFDRDGVGVDVWASFFQSLVLGPLIWAFNLRVLPDGDALFSVWWLLFHCGVVAAICFCVVLFRMQHRAAGIARAPVGWADAVAPATPRLVAQLDAPVRGKPLRVSADGHFLQVATTAGECRVRMRLQDGLADLPKGAGLRIHRSHWVAVDAVSEVRKDGRRYVAVLTTGEELPVSQSYLAALRDAGLVA